MKSKSIFLVIIFIFTGCVPMKRTTQPNVNIQIMDSNSSVIKDAKVTFVNYMMAMKPKSSTIVRKNPDGIFKIEKKSKLELVVFAPDAYHGYEWFYCIEKDGYAPIIKNNLGTSYFSNTIIEKMEKSSLNKKCLWQKYPAKFILK